MSTILITGAGGQLGQEFQALAPRYPSLRFIFADQQALDVTDRNAVARFFDQQALGGCINCAAYTAVDRAESEPEQAWRANAAAPQQLAQACAQQGIPLIHYSTDYVYHNEQNTPFKEEDPTTPRSVYARSKLSGELAALEANPLTMVIRTSWVYSSYGHNFVNTMLRLGRERDHLRVVFDQIGTPTYARGLAAATLDILAKVQASEMPPQALHGIFHYSDEGVCSWYDFALAIFELAGIDCHVTPIETKDYPTPAPRPPFSVLNKAKIKATFGIEIPHWRQRLAEMLSPAK
jgi:dTDP-4-dehydrorhamnose reductase